MQAAITNYTAVLDYQEYFENAISYEQYQQNFQEEIALGDKSPFAEYLPQNWQRQSRLDRKLILTDDLKTAIANLKSKLYWLIITEHWCGDASQINPIIEKIAAESDGKIESRYVYRDADEALINAHLTDGKSKSIPILLQLNEYFNVVDTYGPRPAEAQELVKSILAEGGSYSVPLHAWYAKDKQKAIQQDLLRLIEFR